MSHSVRTGLLTLSADLTELERLGREAAQACEDSGVAELVAALQPVATSATARWYTQVDRETGRTGKIAVEVRSLRKGFTVVSIGSTSTAVSESGAPVPMVVRRPRADSTARKLIARGEPIPAGWRVVRNRGAGLIIEGPNPKASDGGSPLKDLVVTPADAAFARFAGQADGIAQTALSRRGGVSMRRGA